MNHWPHVLAVLVGAGLTVQVGMNSTLRMVIGSPVIATIVNFTVGLAALLLVAAALLALTLAGQMIAAPAVDKYGVLGFPQSALTPARLLGAMLVIAGALLMVRR